MKIGTSPQTMNLTSTKCSGHPCCSLNSDHCCPSQSIVFTQSSKTVKEKIDTQSLGFLFLVDVGGFSHPSEKYADRKKKWIIFNPKDRGEKSSKPPTRWWTFPTKIPSIYEHLGVLLKIYIRVLGDGRSEERQHLFENIGYWTCTSRIVSTVGNKKFYLTARPKSSFLENHEVTTSRLEYPSLLELMNVISAPQVWKASKSWLAMKDIFWLGHD